MLLHIHRCWANQTKSCLNHWDVIILSWLSCSITLVGGIKCIFPYTTWRWWYPMTFLRNHQPNGMYTVWCCGSWLYNVHSFIHLFRFQPHDTPHKQLYCQHVVLGVCCCLHIPPPALLSVFIQCALLVNCCLRSYPAFAGCKPMCLLAKPQLALSVFTQLLLVETPSLLLMSLICVGCFTMCCWLKPE